MCRGVLQKASRKKNSPGVKSEAVLFYVKCHYLTSERMYIY